MFYNKQKSASKEKYVRFLSIVGSLSHLFSESKVPYLYYRVAEKIFCQAFEAHDLSRSDIALDAAKDMQGIGLKTFLKKSDKTLQKIAEFNKDRFIYEKLEPQELVMQISKLRNKRIDFAQNLSSVHNSIYHCVLRDEDFFHLYEEKMDFIDIKNIQDIQKKKNTIWFHDGLHEYNFNLSKSTLLKRFETKNILKSFQITILNKPLDEIKNCLEAKDNSIIRGEGIVAEVYLPLYGRDKKVSLKSGLNQWNAAGRARDKDEVYIPIPAKVHRIAHNFFPPRDEQFVLKLPNATTINAKVCQDNSKALMSNPNKVLGRWILRDVLKLKEGELVTYEKLEEMGIDSVKISKFYDGSYRMDFSKIGSYEDFMSINSTGS